jgi:hypothetical protein
MRVKTVQWVVASALVIAAANPPRLAAQAQKKQHDSYMLIEMGTLSGPESFLSGPGLQVVNNSGTFVGEADTSIPHPYPDANGHPFIRHGIEWKNGVLTDLPRQWHHRGRVRNRCGRSRNRFFGISCCPLE